MGCDIHGICEVKENGVWRRNTESVFRNPYYLSDGALAERRIKQPDFERFDWQENEFQTDPSTSRDYDWFAVLADVRNGRGFAGIPTGDGFAVIAEPRGVPDDACEEWKEEVKQWSGDMHSQSFLYVEDFENFDWSQTTKKSGVISLQEYELIRGENKAPDTWCGMTSGPGIVVVDMESADKILEGNTLFLREYDPFAYRNEKPKEHIVGPTSGHQIMVNYIWGILYSDWFKSNIEEVVEPMKKLKGKYEDVRFVFGFDN